MTAQQPEGIKRTDLQQNDLSVPGHEVVQARVDLSEEIIYVLEGSLEYQIEGQPPTTHEAGEVLVVPAGVIHAVRNAGSGNAAELATYVVERRSRSSRWSSERQRSCEDHPVLARIGPILDLSI